jgi:hypothetical protein
MLRKPLVRRCALGALAGLLSGIVLAFALGSAAAGLVLGLAVGAGYGLAGGPKSGATLDGGMAAVALGIALWTAGSVTLLPLLRGEEPYWTADDMRLATRPWSAGCCMASALGWWPGPSIC